MEVYCAISSKQPRLVFQYCFFLVRILVTLLTSEKALINEPNNHRTTLTSELNNHSTNLYHKSIKWSSCSWYQQSNTGNNTGSNNIRLTSLITKMIAIPGVSLHFMLSCFKGRVQFRTDCTLADSDRGRF